MGGADDVSENSSGTPLTPAWSRRFTHQIASRRYQSVQMGELRAMIRIWGITECTLVWDTRISRICSRGCSSRVRERRVSAGAVALDSSSVQGEL